LLAEQGYRRAGSPDHAQNGPARRGQATDDVLGGTAVALANRTIQAVLAVMPGDIDTLQRLKTQLSQIQDAFPPFDGAVTQEGQIWTPSRIQGPGGPCWCWDRMMRNSPPVCMGSESRRTALREKPTYWPQAIAGLVEVLKSDSPIRKLCAASGTKQQLVRESRRHLH
jgi:hypothetical protein